MQSWEINKEQSNEITTLRQQLAEAQAIIQQAGNLEAAFNEMMLEHDMALIKLEEAQAKNREYESGFLKIRLALGLDLHGHDDLIEVAKSLTAQLAAAKVQGEPVAYFQLIDGIHYNQVANTYKDDDDVFPLYRHPAPSTEKVSQEPDPQLCKFYQVDSYHALVEAMEKHILKLQERVVSAEKPFSFMPQRVREG